MAIAARSLSSVQGTSTLTLAIFVSTCPTPSAAFDKSLAPPPMFSMFPPPPSRASQACFSNLTRARSRSSCSAVSAQHSSAHRLRNPSLHQVPLARDLRHRSLSYAPHHPHNRLLRALRPPSEPQMSRNRDDGLMGELLVVRILHARSPPAPLLLPPTILTWQSAPFMRSSWQPCALARSQPLAAAQ